jgi:hypothetical protein
MSEEQDRLRLQLERNLANYKAAGLTDDAAAVEERLANLDTEFEAAAAAPEVVPSTAPDFGTGKYEERTVVQLRALAESKGLPTSGSKDELIATLRES